MEIRSNVSMRPRILNGDLPSSGDPRALRLRNRRVVLQMLHTGGVHTITDLAAGTQLSRPTTKQAIDDLIETGLILVVDADGTQEPVLGRPAQKFRFRAEAGHVLGVDVGAHKILAVITDLAGEIRAEIRRAVDPTWSAARRLGELETAVEDVIGASGLAADDITDSGIATVGSVDKAGTVIFCKAMPEWEGQNPAERVTQRFGIPSRGASDMPMAVLAEHWRGAARHCQDMVYLHAGWRFGAALLIGGQPHYGHHFAATQIGMWRGIQWRASYEEFLHANGPGAISNGGAAALFKAAAANDSVAVARVDELTAEMSQGLAPIIVTVDPEILVVGGGLSSAGETIVGPLRKHIKQETDFPPRVVCSTLGDTAVALGAVRLALDRAEEKLFADIGLQRS